MKLFERPTVNSVAQHLKEKFAETDFIFNLDPGQRVSILKISYTGDLSPYIVLSSLEKFKDDFLLHINNMHVVADRSNKVG